MGGDALCGSYLDKYLGVGFSVRGATVEPVEKRVNGASETLSTFKLSKALTREMNLEVEARMHKAFFKSKWTYESFLTPLNPALSKRVDDFGRRLHFRDAHDRH